MRYKGRIFRPPSEAYSLIVQITYGCSHNKCTFCDMYSDKQFKIRPIEEVYEDFDMARASYAHVRRIFLADGDALIRKTSDLVAILKYIKKTFPECERVASYGSPQSILLKSPDDLKLLCELGLQIIYLGLESGSDIVLEKVIKGETCDEIVRSGHMVKDAGMQLSVTAILGLGGTELWEEHAIQTARALSRMKPHYIGLLTLMFEGTPPLQQAWEAGEFQLLDAKQVAQETLLLLRHLDSEGSMIRSNHASNFLNLRGNLNVDKPRLISALEHALTDDRLFKPNIYRGL